MSSHDLNHWVLELAGGVTFDFGTAATDYPFAVQVEVGPPDLTTEDQRHPTSDGVIFGRDLLGGFLLTFKVTTIPVGDRDPAIKIGTALDQASFFKAKWLNSSSRRIPGEYVSLTNKMRKRTVYGRPRRCAPDYAAARRGRVGLVADFQTNNPFFFSSVENAAIFNNNGGVSLTGFRAPITFPIVAGDAPAITNAFIHNDGDVPAWPLVEFHGPGNHMSFTMLDPGWTIEVDGPLGYDEVLLVDTRPWSRGATMNGQPANGRVLGSQLEKCSIPAGSWEGQFRVIDQTGTAMSVVHWRDAFASL